MCSGNFHTCAEADSVMAFILLCSLMGVITKRADGSISAIFTAPLSVKHPCWLSGNPPNRQTGSSGSLYLNLTDNNNNHDYSLIFPIPFSVLLSTLT